MSVETAGKSGKLTAAFDSGLAAGGDGLRRRNNVVGPKGKGKSVSDDIRLRSGSYDESAFSAGKQSSRWTPTSRSLLISLSLLALFLRIFRINQPKQVVFDEVHFGGFANHYLKGTYYFDVHPPLGKLLIAAVGWLNGYKGNFSFANIGMEYMEDPTVPFVQLRMFMAMFGTASVIFAFATMIEMGFSPLAASVAATFLIFDNALVTQTRFILLDAMLMGFMLAAVYSWVKFRQLRYEPFTTKWWSYMIACGVSLGCTVGVKLVGLFTIGLIGFATLYDLWELSDWKRQMTDSSLYKHFFARALGLAAVPVALYLSFYYIHFELLTHSGPGDVFMSAPFQKTLKGNKLNTDGRAAYFDQVIRIQSRVDDILLHSHEHRYPLKHLDGKISSEGQQVTGYSAKDPNNEWQLIREPKEGESKELDPKMLDKYGRLRIRNGDLVRIMHKGTQKFLIAHDVASPLTKTNMEVTMFDEEKRPEERDHMIWRVEADELQVRSLSTRLKFVNVKTGVALLNFKKKLPTWGFGQIEINGCKKSTSNDLSYYWTISEILNERTPEEEVEMKKAARQTHRVPFLQKFWELQMTSIQSNARLTEQHPFMSTPSEWPLPKAGISFWDKQANRRIYLLGNIFAWPLAFASLFLIAIRYGKDVFREHRGLIPIRNQDHFYKRYGKKLAFLLGGYLIHYLPFFLMGRSLYLHHYLPAYMFSAMVLGAGFDSLTRHSPQLRRYTAVILVTGVLVAFWYLLPLIYGLEVPKEIMNQRKLMVGWNWT